MADREARDPVLLADILARTEALSAKAAGSSVAPALWREVVGERIAGRSRPGKLEQGVLTVFVPSSVWAQELSLLGSELLERLRERGVGATQLIFRVERFNEAPQKFEPRPLPAPSKQAMLPEGLEARLGQIEDEELKAAVREAASLFLRAEPKRGR